MAMTDDADLFAATDAPEDVTRPLAVRMRPATLDEVVGQDHVLGPGSPLRRLANPASKGSLTAPSSIILFGPPGVGKTTLAYIVAKQSGRVFEELSAVTSGIKDVRAVLDRAHRRLVAEGKETVLFIDEVHRFSKSQQDALLPSVENRDVTFIAATTENPSFSVIKPLLSRSVVVKLESLEPDDLKTLIERALNDPRGLKGEVRATDEAVDEIVRMAGGDARKTLTIPGGRRRGDDRRHGPQEGRAPADHHPRGRQPGHGRGHRAVRQGRRRPLRRHLRIHQIDARLGRRRRTALSGPHDPRGRGPAVHRPAHHDRRRRGGRYGRPQILGGHGGRRAGRGHDRHARGAHHPGGGHRGRGHRAQIQRQLPAIDCALADVDAGRIGEVPLHLRNAPTKLMKDWGNHEGYRYAHDWPGAVAPQQYMPDELVGREYYHPNDRGYEHEVKPRLDRIRAILHAEQPKPGTDGER